MSIPNSRRIPLSSTHADSHEHSNPYLAHHFEDINQQSESHTLGLWVFLATEILFFGGLFLAFTIYHVMFNDAFSIASSRLSIKWGVINTVILLISSFTMAMGVYFGQTGKIKSLKVMLIATLALAGAFLGIKTIEYKEKFDHHLVPGPNFVFKLDDSAHGHGMEPGRVAEVLKRDPYVETHAQLFFVMYFCITGLHGIHILIGMGVIGWMLVRTMRGEFNAQWNAPIELTGLYWHLVDIIWIFVFPIIYLAHRH